MDKKEEAGSEVKSRNQACSVPTHQIQQPTQWPHEISTLQLPPPTSLLEPPSAVCKSKKSLSEGLLKVVGWVIQIHNMLFNMKNVCQLALF